MAGTAQRAALVCLSLGLLALGGPARTAQLPAGSYHATGWDWYCGAFSSTHGTFSSAWRALARYTDGCPVAGAVTTNTCSGALAAGSGESGSCAYIRTKQPIQSDSVGGYIDWNSTCPSGTSFRAASGLCEDGAYDALKNNEIACGGVWGGNPIHLGTGGKHQIEEDYAGQGPAALRLTRRYGTTMPRTGQIGEWWRHAYDHRLVPGTDGGIPFARVERPAGNEHLFRLVNGAWKPDADINARLEQLPDGWRYTASDGSQERYDPEGRLLSLQTPAGHVTTLTYSDGTGSPPGGGTYAGTSTPLPPGLLLRVTNHFALSLAFEYASALEVSSVTTPAGGRIAYAYDADGNLTSVTYPDGSSKTYHYEDPNHPHALTGITDENGQRYATWTYDTQGRAIRSEHAGGAERVDLTYNPDGSTTVTDALGTARTYGFATVLGVMKGAGLSQPGGAGCGPASSAMTYDANGNVATRDDFNGHRTRHWHDLARNLETTRVEGLAVANGSEQVQPETRTFTTAWHPAWRLPTVEKTYTGGADSAGTPLGTLVKTVASAYDAAGNLLTRTETDNVRNASRTWTYTYFSLGRPATADGPRTDVADVTTYAYYPDDDADPARRSRLWKVTNALGHVSEIQSYDLDGHPTQVRDPNGLVTTLAYDLRGRLIRRTAGTQTTAYDYDPAGNLTGLTLPDGSVTAFSHDAAHRLTGIQDAQGNRIAYTLDGLGNRVAETVYDAQGNPVRHLDRAFDTLGRLWKEVRRVNGQAAVTEYAYDALGNPTLRADPLNHAIRNTYDALDRLSRSEDALQGRTDLARDTTDSVIAVTDPKGFSTSYVADAFGQVRQETSPDRGTTTYTYDAAGNLKTKTDARGVLTTYTYDALNRLTRVYWNPDIHTDFQYDAGPHGVGRLTGMTSLQAATTWTYDTYGAVTGKQQTVQKRPGSVNLALLYAFDAAGRLTQLTYPSGKVVAYGYDQGRLARISVNGQPLLFGVAYHPFGAARAWTWGNGSPYARRFDANGWLQDYPLGNLIRRLDYDAAGRITAYTHPGQPRFDQTFAYDALDRLTAQTTYQGNAGWTYDANGNRTRFISGNTHYPYTLAAGSNRLMRVAGPVARTYSHDAAGNVTGDASIRFLIDRDGRVREASGAWGSARYLVDGLGQRLEKVRYFPNAIPHRQGTLDATYYAYDGDGRLLGEYDQTGQPLQETVFLGNTPVAVLKGNALYFVYADHLDAPRLITDTRNRTVWRWDAADPFGTGLPDENPSGLGTFTYNPRFPGQYFDKETGLHYNYLRDCYDPRTGRYCQPDPIGLAGGLNLYSYVGGNPLSFVDPLGLFFEFNNSQRSLTWVDPNTGTRSPSTTWPARSGSSHLQPLPQGWYYVNPKQTPVREEKTAMTDTCGNAYKFRLVPQFETNRSGLLIHPDGGKPGTAGCIGAQGCTSSLRQFLESVLPGGSGGGLTLKVVP